MSSRISLLLLATLMAVPLLARPKIDVIVMTNGDRLTCEIKKLDHGLLYAGLDYVDGTVSIDWSKVARLESTQMFAVETEDGMTYTGALRTVESPGGQPRKIEIVESSAQTETAVEQSSVVVAEQFGDSLWRRFSGDLSTGLIYSKGSNNTQYDLGLDLSYKRERSSANLSYSSAFSNSSGANRTTRNQLDFSAEHLMRWNNWYYGGVANFLQSSSQNINFQSTYGGGVGHYFKHTTSTRARVTPGVALQNTLYSHTSGQKNVVGLISGELYMFRFKKTDLTVRPVLFPSLTDPGRVLFNLNAQYKVQIISDLWWNVTLYGNWDNRPPAGFNGSDYGTSTGIAYSFH